LKSKPGVDESSMESTLQPRRWWQRTRVRLSLRTLMLLVLALACGLGWLVNSARSQREAVEAIERAGGKAFYGWQLRSNKVNAGFQDLAPIANPLPPWPKWFVDRVGPDYYSTVWLVMIPGQADPVMPYVGRLRQVEELDFLPMGKDQAMGPSDAGMVHLWGLTRLKQLKLGVHTRNGAIGSKITGKGLAVIAGATGLQYLELEGVPLTDPDLAALRGLTDLVHLEINSPDITDLGLAHLSGLVELRRLHLSGTQVTAAGIAHLRGLTKLQDLNLALTKVESLETCRPLASLTSLTLARTPIGDAGLAPVSEPGFAGLIRLNLFNTRVSDAGLMHLRGLPTLRYVDLVGSDVTASGIAEFQKVRPTVNVSVVRRAATPPPPRRPPAPAKK
jgi:internalin A